MITRLLIARHGNTFSPGDVVRRVGLTDLPLVSSGLQQAARLGGYLQQHNLIPDQIFTSRLQRTQQTAEHAQREMNTRITVQSLAIFDEIDYGPDENQAEADVIARLGRDALTAWETQAIVPDGWHVDPDKLIQNWHEFAQMLLQEHKGQTILVVTSNGIARFAPYLTGDFTAFAARHSIKLATGALAVFENQPSSPDWSCRQWNEIPVALSDE